MLEVVKSPVPRNKVNYNKVVPFKSAQPNLENFYASIVKACAIVRGDFAQIDRNPDLIIELTLTHFWLAYLAQNNSNQYIRFLNIANFIEYLKVNFSKEINPKLLFFFQEFIDNEPHLLKSFNNLNKEFVEQKLKFFKFSLVEALQTFARSAIPREEDPISLTPQGNNLKPRPQGAKENINLPKSSMDAEEYTNTCLISLGFFELRVGNNSGIMERKEYLQDVIKSDSITLKQVEHSKLMKLSDIIDKYKKEVKFYNATFGYLKPENKEKLIEKYLGESGFLNSSKVTRATEILSSQDKIIEAQKKMNFLIEVIDLMSVIADQFKKEAYMLYSALNPLTKQDDFFRAHGIPDDVEWADPVEIEEDSYASTSDDSDKENTDSDGSDSDTFVRKSTMDKTGYSNPVSEAIQSQHLLPLPLHKLADSAPITVSLSLLRI